MEYSFQRLTRIFTIQVQSLYENISYIYIYSSIHSMTLKNYSTRIWGAEKRTAIVVTIVKVVNIIRQNLQWQNVHFYDMTFERRGNAVLMHTIFCNNPGPRKYITLCSLELTAIVSGRSFNEWIIFSKVLNRLLINLTREQKISWILKHFE